MTYKNFEKKDNFPKILIEETDFLLFVTMVSSLIISIVITFWLRNRILFSGIYKFLANNKVPDILASIFAYVLTGCIIFMVLILSLIIAIVVLLKLITFFRKTYSKLSHACMLNRICHLPFTVEEMEKYRTAGLGELLLLVLKMETYKEYDGHKLRPVLSEMHLIREKNEQLYENIKIVFKEDLDDNGFLKKDIRNTVHTFLCEETDIDKKSITSFLDHLDAGKDFK
jgi:hypothetical protein